MATFQEIIDSARVALQDVDKVRYSDDELLEYAIDGVLEARKLRPDFFLGGYATIPSSYSLTSTVPLPSLYVAYLKDFLVFKSEVRDDEYAVDGRAAAMLARFRSGLMSV